MSGQDFSVISAKLEKHIEAGEKISKEQNEANRVANAQKAKINHDTRVAKKYVSLQHSAATRGIKFNLTLQSLSNVMKSKKCFFTQKPINGNNRTIDRVNNELGYETGNIRAAHVDFNCKKGNLSDEEILQLYKGMVKHRRLRGIE